MEQALLMPQRMACEDRVSELDDIETLVIRYRAQVLRLVALTLKDPDEAASVTQDCFLRAYATRGQFRGQCPVSAWLLQIAYNLARDRLRTRKFQFWRRVRSQAMDASELANWLASRDRSSESQLLAREQVQQVWAAVADLSPRQRSVFVLRFVEEMELPDIVAATGMNMATVKTHLYRALHEIRRRLDTKGGAAR